MNRTLFLIFNHQFTPAQDEDARSSLGVDRIVPLPPDMQRLWSAIPPELPQISDYLDPIRDWLLTNARPDDYVLIQGDFGACYLMALFAEEKGLVPIYSTTRREAMEEPQPDGSVRLTHRFEHQMFRRYGR